MNAAVMLSEGGISGSTVAAIGVIATIVLGIVGIYFMANQRAVAKDGIDRSRAADLIKPYQVQIDQLRADAGVARTDCAAAIAEERRQCQARIETRDQIIRDRDRRIDELEDQLRGNRP